MARRYELKARAEAQARTRQQIVDAAIHLHQTLGPARTTVTAIAEHAGVGRLTVYRHFPQEADLYAACSSTYWERHPLPDPEPWRAIADPAQRLRAALADSYAYHRRTAAMTNRVLADASDSPRMVPYHQHWRDAAEVVASGWKLTGRAHRRTRAAVGLALSFSTWQSLIHDQGLDDREAVDLMTSLIARWASGRSSAGSSSDDPGAQLA
ncbi:MAG: TetR family transcriptional regulator [Actinobacteria bacterium]|nr:TetR family transcriptional regulator [Actinomycetota bacterium]